MHTDAIVVGAGFAGLRTAQRLVAAGRSVTVLEARDRVGGRICPGEIAGRSIDLGGMWLGPTQQRLDQLTSEIGMQRYPTWLEGECSIEFRGRFGRAPGEDFDRILGTPNRLRLLKLNWELERLCKNLPVTAPWDHPKADELDAQTVASWTAQRTSSPDVQHLMNLVCQAVFCTEARELSMLYFAFYCKAAGGLLVLLAGGPGGAQNFLFDGGLHQAAQHLADDLAGHIELDAPVVAVEQTEERVSVITAGGETHTASRLVLAIPPPLAREITWAPGLSQDRARLLARQTMGSTIKGWLAYETPFWRETQHNAFVMTDTSAFSPAFDATPPGSSIGLIAGFFESVEGRSVAESSPQERRDIAISTLVRHLGARAAHPIAYVDKDWTAEQWSRGCYGATMPPGVLTTVGHLMRTPFGLVHWAGTETATEWSGYVEGALESGDRAAREVLARLRER